jgi:tetratricopeptide (TPR) repeat protein
MRASAEAYEAGNQAFYDGDLEGAVRFWEEAVGALRPEDDAWAADLYENLGLGLWKLGRLVAASRAFLRALDGNLSAREQCLRGLVSCAFREGRPLDGERWLTIYERAFGPHPEGWTRVTRT